jgi:hypothetical protein
MYTVLSWVKTNHGAATHIRRGGDGFSMAPFPGNELPGYDHLVPTGQSIA